MFISEFNVHHHHHHQQEQKQKQKTQQIKNLFIYSFHLIKHFIIKSLKKNTKFILTGESSPK
jgi:hypothetical protein